MYIYMFFIVVVVVGGVDMLISLVTLINTTYFFKLSMFINC